MSAGVAVPVVRAPVRQLPPVIPVQAEPALSVPASLPFLFPPLLFDCFSDCLLSVRFHSVSETPLPRLSSCLRPGS